MTNAIGVALPADSDVANLLVDRTSELARTLNARWIAFIVCNDAMPTAPAQQALYQAELAMRAGGTVFLCEGDDVAQTLIALASVQNIDILILGAPKRNGLMRRFRRGVIDRIVRAARPFDVVVIPNA